MKFIGIAVLITYIFCAPARAEFYGSASMSGFQFTSDSLGDISGEAVSAALGYSLYGFLGFEGRAGLGFGSDRSAVLVDGAPVFFDLRLENFLSAYVRPQLPLGPLRIYGLAGYSQTTFEAFGGSGSRDGISYGVGLGTKDKNGVQFNLEALRIIDADTYIVNALNFNIQFPLF